jgi:hypothetical protein
VCGASAFVTITAKVNERFQKENVTLMRLLGILLAIRTRDGCSAAKDESLCAATLILVLTGERLPQISARRTARAALDGKRLWI